MDQYQDLTLEGIMAAVTRKQLKASLRTIRQNLSEDATDPDNPESSAAAKVRMVERLEARIRGDA